MVLEFKPTAEKDLQYWFDNNNKPILKKIENLLKNVQNTPFSGIGKPERLKGDLSGYWSRRINGEHRMVYTVVEDTITIFSLRGHY